MRDDGRVIQGSFPRGVGRLGGVAVQCRALPLGFAFALPPQCLRLDAGGGQPLPQAVRQRMELLFGSGFADVRVHTSPQIAVMGAEAFTRGTHIHFAPGRYDPASPQGRQILGHELAHVVQQRSGRVGNPFGSGVAVISNSMLEAEAERMGQKAAQLGVTIQPKVLQLGKDVLGKRRNPVVLIQEEQEKKKAAAEVLKGLIDIELKESASHDDWEGEGVDLIMAREHFNVSDANKEKVNEWGRDKGCHTCNTHLVSDDDQAWIGDHIPPTQLQDRFLEPLGFNDKSRLLYPQCDTCAEKQSTLVKSLNALKSDKKELKKVVEGLNKNLLTKGLAKYPGVLSSGGKVTQNEGKDIQELGIKHGCHSCPKSFPKSKYHADHCPPKEFYTDYMQKVVADLGDKPLVKNWKWQAKPQCPRCSNGQGGAMSVLSKQAMLYNTRYLKNPDYKQQKK
jgi:hypothetical protein